MPHITDEDLKTTAELFAHTKKLAAEKALLRECLLAVTDELEKPYAGVASTVTAIRDARQLLKETQ